MKSRIFITGSIILFWVFTLQAQIKIHNDNHVSIGSLTKSYGVQVQPNGYTYFQASLPQNYAWMNLTFANTNLSKCYIVQFGDEHTFFVQGNGNVHSTSCLIDTELGMEKSVQSVDSVLSKILMLKSVFFKPKEMINQDTMSITDKYGSTHSLFKSTRIDDSTNRFIDPGVVKTLNAEKERKYIGLISGEVEKIIPELVRTKPDGTKGIAYYSLTSLLVEAIKEQQAEIEKIKKLMGSSYMKSDSQQSFTLKEDTTDPENQSGKALNFLSQNQPNPFTEKTTIRYKTSNVLKKASIFVFDLQGSLMKSFEELEQQEGEITIRGYDLKPGMYIYTLVIDGTEMDSKRMILTN